jgi:hypothetical protein
MMLSGYQLHTPSVPKCLSLENCVSLTDTLFGRLTLRDGVVRYYAIVAPKLDVSKEIQCLLAPIQQHVHGYKSYVLLCVSNNNVS